MEAWENFLKLQDLEYGVEVVTKWLRPLKVTNFDACNLYLQAGDTFQVAWFDEHIKKKAAATLRNNNNKRIKVHINSPEKQEAKPSKKSVRPSPQVKILLDELDPHNTFDNYILTQDNLLITKLLSSLVGFDLETSTPLPHPPTLGAMNPIYIHGISGTGKTHLLQAVAHALQARGIKTLYARADTFTDHVVNAIRSGEMSIFRQTYRNADVLLIDDVHIFSRKAATQEEFFHTFNTLHLSGRQILLAANCSPAELQSIEPRLVSRFEWGIVLPLALYKETDLKAIVQKRAESFNFPLHEKILSFLIETFSSSSKALIRALEALMLRIPSQSGPVTLPTAKALLKDLIQDEEHKQLTPEKIVHTISDYFGVEKEDILGKGQSRDCVLPRQMAMHFCRTQLSMPFMKIGDLFGKDHSTVMTSVKLIQRAIDGDDHEIAAKWDALIKKLKS